MDRDAECLITLCCKEGYFPYKKVGLVLWQYPPRPPEYINFFKPFQSWPVTHLVVPIGVSHISLRHKKYSRGSGRKRTKNKRTIWAWVNSSARRLSCDTLHSLHICRLSLSVFFLQNFHKPRGMLIHLDWSSLTAHGPYLMPTGLFCCPLSTATLHLPSPTLSL